MTKFLLFASPTYYPCGGMHDCHGVFDTLAEAEAAMSAVPHSCMDDCHVMQAPEMVGYDYDEDGVFLRTRPLSYYIDKTDPFA